MQRPGATLFATGADFAPTCTYDQWCDTLEAVKLSARGAQWWLGDALNHGEACFGLEMVAAAIDPSDLALGEGTIRSCQWVADKIPFAHRRTELSWSHHRAVASFSLGEIDLWLADAISEGWSSQELREAVRDKRGGAPPRPDVEGGEEGTGPEREWPDVYDHPRFGEAARLRFGMKLGEEIAEFVVWWTERHGRIIEV